MTKYFSFFSLLMISYLGFGQDSLVYDEPFLLGKKEATVSLKTGLLPQAETAFLEMQSAAKKDSLQLKIVSSFRSYAAQKRIWNRKYRRYLEAGLTPEKALKKIIEYSTLPGTSRHHWGTEIDIINAEPVLEGDVLLEKHFHSGGAYEKLRLWLTKNAATYGYELVYTKDSLRKGFFYEPWHYSFAPLSEKFLSSYLEKHLIEKVAKDSTLLGSKYLSKTFLNNYLNENIKGVSHRVRQ